MTDTVRVKPWPGLILDGIPAAGADIPRALADEWIGNHLVVLAPAPAPPNPPSSSDVEPPKRRSKRR